MTKQRISVIVTVLNEERTIVSLLNSLAKQTLLPSEVLIADGGSSDKTIQLIKAWQAKHKKFSVKLFQKKGYRGIGRNTAIKNSANELIAITDAGCIPDEYWLEKLYKAFEKKSPDVVAGYYWAEPKTSLEEAIIPYILVMPDKVNPEDFLPATRSMLIKKTVWEKVGGFDEVLPTCEDYVFAKALKKQGCSILFTSKAKVKWLPISTLAHFYKTIREQAQYDVVAGVTRKKAVLVVVRYALLIVLLGILIGSKSLGLLSVLFVGGLLYLLWSIVKNIRYVPRGWLWLPVLQIIADIGVVKGTLTGWYNTSTVGK